MQPFERLYDPRQERPKANAAETQRQGMTQGPIQTSVPTGIGIRRIIPPRAQDGRDNRVLQIINDLFGPKETEEVQEYNAPTLRIHAGTGRIDP